MAGMKVETKVSAVKVAQHFADDPEFALDVFGYLAENGKMWDLDWYFQPNDFHKDGVNYVKREIDRLKYLNDLSFFSKHTI